MDKLTKLCTLAAVMALLGAAGPMPMESLTGTFHQVQNLQEAEVPVLVPTAVPKDYGYVSLVSHLGRPWVTAGGYVIVIAARPLCGGASCTYAILRGERGEMGYPGPESHITHLGDGTPAYYIARGCTINCDESAQLMWMRGTTRYTLSVRAGSLTEVIAIERGLRPLLTLPR